jgi:hypothetical protein
VKIQNTKHNKTNTRLEASVKHLALAKPHIAKTSPAQLQTSSGHTNISPKASPKHRQRITRSIPKPLGITNTGPKHLPKYHP